MSDQPRDPSAGRRQSARWDALCASVDNVIRRRPLFLRDGDHTELPQIRGRVEHGLQSVPVYKIAAESSRYAELDSWLNGHQRRSAARRRSDLRHDPVHLYRIGDIYLVRDGNRRVSVASARGQLFLPAYVTEYAIDGAQDLARVRGRLLVEEQHAFLEATGLARVRPDHQICCTTLGGYGSLLQHIRSAYDDSGLTPDDAAVWFDQIYQPIAALLRRHRITDLLPHYSEADLFVWSMDHSLRLSDRHLPTSQAARCRHQRACAYTALRFVASLRRAIQPAVRQLAVNG
ncbi:MAG TPA: hypothetical protein VFS21_12540 [Roseiflexaceae bacterium]|nr:hypothetical protein [Roseiflexaceae bacterium]